MLTLVLLLLLLLLLLSYLTVNGCDMNPCPLIVICDFWCFHQTVRYLFTGKTVHHTAKVTEEVNRKCHPENTVVQSWNLNSNFPGLESHGIRPRSWKVTENQPNCCLIFDPCTSKSVWQPNPLGELRLYKHTWKSDLFLITTWLNTLEKSWKMDINDDKWSRKVMENHFQSSACTVYLPMHISKKHHVYCRSGPKRNSFVVLVVTSTHHWKWCLFLVTLATASLTHWIMRCLTAPTCSRRRIFSRRARPACGQRMIANVGPLCLIPRVFKVCRPMRTVVHVFCSRYYIFFN